MALSNQNDHVLTEDDRREEKRVLYFNEFSVLLPKKGCDNNKPSTFRRVPAWPKDISLGGIRFSCQSELPEQRVLIEKDDLGSRFAELEIVRSTKLPNGWWEYGAVVLRFVTDSDIDVLSLSQTNFDE